MENLDIVMERITAYRLECFGQWEPHDEEMTRAAAQDVLTQGYSNGDAFAYLRCLEHVDPDLDETIALRRMAEISRKYVKGVK